MFSKISREEYHYYSSKNPAPKFNSYFKQLGLNLKQISLFKMTYNKLLTWPPHIIVKCYRSEHGT